MVSAAQQIAALQRSNAIARSVRGVISEFIKPLPRNIPKVMLLEAPFIGMRNTERVAHAAMEDTLNKALARGERRKYTGATLTDFGALS